MGKVTIEITEQELRELVIEELERRLGSIQISKEDVSIQVKSKQNYKSEWEEASFRAVVIKNY